MSKPRLRVFLDANVIFSGLYSSRGAPGTILKYFVEGCITLVVSQQVLEEVIRTIKEKLPESLAALNRFLINAPPEVIANPSSDEIRRWAKNIHTSDAVILAAALAAHPDYFITGDNHFLENRAIKEGVDLKIISPAQFMTLMEQDSDIN